MRAAGATKNVLAGVMNFTAVLIFLFSGQVRWLEAVVEQAQKSGVQNQGVLVLQLPGGVRVEIADVKQATLAAAVVRALAQPC